MNFISKIKLSHQLKKQYELLHQAFVPAVQKEVQLFYEIAENSHRLYDNLEHDKQMINDFLTLGKKIQKTTTLLETLTRQAELYRKDEDYVKTYDLYKAIKAKQKERHATYYTEQVLEKSVEYTTDYSTYLSGDVMITTPTTMQTMKYNYVDKEVVDVAEYNKLTNEIKLLTARIEKIPNYQVCLRKTAIEVKVLSVSQKLESQKQKAQDKKYYQDLLNNIEDSLKLYPKQQNELQQLYTEFLKNLEQVEQIATQANDITNQLAKLNQNSILNHLNKKTKEYPFSLLSNTRSNGKVYTFYIGNINFTKAMYSKQLKPFEIDYNLYNQTKDKLCQIVAEFKNQQLPQAKKSASKEPGKTEFAI